MISQNQFQTRTYETVQAILCEACPSPDVLREPILTSTGRGRGYRTHFNGLDTPQCEEIKQHARREEVTRLEGFGVHLVAYHHRDCRLGVFAGDFSLYAKCYLHQHFGVDPKSAADVAKLYGLDPATVAKVSDLYRNYRNRGTRDWLIRSFAKGTIGAEIARLENSQARFEAGRRAS